MDKFDILIPVFNESENIIPVLKSLEQHLKTPFRVLIAYDFDEDNTLPALKRYQEESENPVEIELVKNQGKGAHGAVLTGFRHSTAPAVLVFPADDDYNAGRLDAMFDKFKAGYDIVAASRFIPGGRMVNCPWLKALLVRTSAFTLYYLARIPTHDSSNGFRLFSRRVLDEIKIESTQGFTYSIELLVKTHRLGWRIGEVPVEWYERTKGQSRFKVLKWMRAYLRWYFYAFATTYLRRPPNTVPRQEVRL
jgi:glycosyltransferase involved in cell wall biosynthesis